MLEFAFAEIFPGEKSERVKMIQEILKEDPEIYPEGLVTGYYGPLTKKAVERLQKRCKLPETGILDEPTIKCIFPNVKIEVISPNGGENWDRNQIQTIKWKISAEPNEELLMREKMIWKKVSIDLFKRVPGAIPICPPCPAGKECLPCSPPYSSVFVKHIATVDPFDTAYSWKITPDIPNGSDYVIRISMGEKIFPTVFSWSLSFDESDETFTISGEIKLKPDLSEVIRILEEINMNLERITAQLQKAINLLKGIAQ